jgi:hypothetical protein
VADTFVWLVRDLGHPSVPSVERYVLRGRTAKGVTVWDRGAIRFHREGPSLHAFDDEAAAVACCQEIAGRRLAAAALMVARLEAAARSPRVDRVPEGGASSTRACFVWTTERLPFFPAAWRKGW